MVVRQILRADDPVQVGLKQLLHEVDCHCVSGSRTEEARLPLTYPP